ncbi:MAG TPA: protoporphyrinogen oxidase [Casimicrobiaceae bacterium]|nr:protoporphyrinogen oxidase [Casimicrobiaceae bacterium]
MHATQDRYDAIVIGGGLSGLVTAYRLEALALRVIVLEAEAQAGGVIATRESTGYRYETGPNSALDSTPDIASLIEELGIAGQRVETNPAARARYIVHRGRLVALPMSPFALVASPAFSWRAKLRLLREPFIARSGVADESVAAFVRRRLGAEVLERAIDPFVSGIFAGDPERLSVAAAFPKLAALEREHGSLLVGRFGQSRARDTATPARRAASFSFARGMQTLTDALHARLSCVHTRASANAIERSSFGDLHVTAATPTGPLSMSARCVVIAAPTDVAAALVEPHHADAAKALREIVYAPVSIVASGHRRSDVAHPLDGFGVLVPASERMAILGTLFSSSLFPDRAPERHVLLTTFVGGRRHPALAALADDAVQTRAQHALENLLGATHARWSTVVRWPRAIPQYELGHEQRIARIVEACNAVPGLYFCANWIGGVSIGDRVAAGRRTANDVMQQLRSP